MLLAETSSVNVKELSSKLNLSDQEVKQCIYVLSNLKLIEISDENVSLPYRIRIRDRYVSYIKKLLGEVKNEGGK